MKKVIISIVGVFLLSISANALEIDDDMKKHVVEVAKKYDKMSAENRKIEKLRRALNKAIENDVGVLRATIDFDTKEDFLKASKKIIDDWSKEIDQDLEELKKSKK